MSDSRTECPRPDLCRVRYHREAAAVAACAARGRRAAGAGTGAAPSVAAVPPPPAATDPTPFLDVEDLAGRFPDLEFEYEEVGGRWGIHEITVTRRDAPTPDDSYVAFLKWSAVGRQISNVHVAESDRRRGVASAMWEAASAHTPGLRHASRGGQSADGAAWAARVP